MEQEQILRVVSCQNLCIPGVERVLVTLTNDQYTLTQILQLEGRITDYPNGTLIRVSTSIIPT